MALGCNLLDKNEISDKTFLKLYDFCIKKNDCVVLKEISLNSGTKYLLSEKIKDGKVKTQWISKREFLYRKGAKCNELLMSLK